MVSSSKHDKDDKDKKDPGRKGSKFSIADKSGLAFVRKKSEDGKSKVTIEKLKTKTSSASRRDSRPSSRHEDLPDIGRLRIEYGNDETRSGSRYSGSQGGDPYGSREYLTGRYPDPNDQAVYYSDEDEENYGQAPAASYQSGRTGSTNSRYEPPASSGYRSSRGYRYKDTVDTGSATTSSLYDKRWGKEDVPTEESASYHTGSHTSRSSQRTARQQKYYTDSDSDGEVPSASGPRYSQDHRASDTRTVYTDESSCPSRHDPKPRGSYTSSGAVPPPAPSVSSHASSSRRSHRSSHSKASNPFNDPLDSPYRANPRAEVTEADDRASLTGSRASGSTAYGVPVPDHRCSRSSRYYEKRPPSPTSTATTDTTTTSTSTLTARRHAAASGFRAPTRREGREGAYESRRFSGTGHGPDPFQFQVHDNSGTYGGSRSTSTGTSSTADSSIEGGASLSSSSRTTGSSTSGRRYNRGHASGSGSQYPPTGTEEVLHYYEEGASSDSDDTITGAARGTGISRDRRSSGHGKYQRESKGGSSGDRYSGY